MADCVAAEDARQGAVTGKTIEDQDRAWRRWEEYANSIGIGDDLFLDGLPKPNRIKIMGAFALALREGRFQSDMMVHWLRQQSEVPFRMWHRPSGTTIDQTPQRTMTESLGAFYQGYFEHLETKIQRRNNRKHSQQQS